MKKILLSLIVLSYLTSLYAEEQAIPATASEAFDNHMQATKNFITANKTELKIAGNILKIVGALITVHGYKNFLVDIKDHMYSEHTKFSHYYSNEDKQIEPSIVNPWIGQSYAFTDENGKNCAGSFKRKLSRPPFVSGLMIAAYLLSSGSYGLYKEINALLQQRKENKKDTKDTPEQAIQNKEVVGSEAHKAIVPVEEKKELTPSESVVQPEEKNRPKYTPIRLSSNE